jgi:hypothetical protein
MKPKTEQNRNDALKNPISYEIPVLILSKGMPRLFKGIINI